MRFTPALLMPLALAAALAACSKQDNAPGPGGVSMGEARALDEAAEMVEGQRLPVEAMPAQPASASQAAPAAPAAKAATKPAAPASTAAATTAAAKR